MSNGIGRVWAVNAEGGDEGRPNGVGPVWIENADQLGSKLPEPEADDAGKVLGVLNADGDIGWVPDREGMAQVQSDWDQDDPSQVSYIANKPSLATVATTGAYSDLSGTPTIPTVDQTYDAASPNAQSGVAVASALSGKQDTISDLNTIRSGAAAGATAVQPAALNDYATTSALTSGLAAKQDTISDLSTIRSGAAAGATAVQPGDLAAVATSGSYNDLQNKPSIPAAQVNSDWNAVSGVEQILNKPNLATVATTGSYNDLQDKPTIPPGVVVDQTYNAASTNAQSGTAVAGAVATKQDIISDLATIRSGAADGATAVQPGDLATVATSGSYNDLSNKPTIPSTKPLVAGSNITITENANDVTISASVPSISVDQTYDAASTNPQSGTAVAGAVSTKQDIISDLATIRSGASAGATAVQPGDLATVATSGSYTDLFDKPTIPSGAQLVPSATSADEGKFLMVDGNGLPEWSDLSDGSSYSIANGNVTFTPGQYYTDGVVTLSNIRSNGIDYAYNHDGWVLEQDHTYVIAFNIVAFVGYPESGNITGRVWLDGFQETDQVWKFSIDTSASHDESLVGSAIVCPQSTGEVHLNIRYDSNQLAHIPSASVNKAEIVDVTARVNGSGATTYSAGAGLNLTGTTFSVDTTTIATKSDLSAYTPTASLGAVALSNNYNDLSNKPTIPPGVVVDQTYNAASTNAQSGTAVAGALATVDEVPAVTSSDDGKVLKATYSGGTGSYAWESEPVILGLTAGSNVTITEANNAVTIAATDTTYTAGNMISIDSNNSNAIGVSTTAGITDIQLVNALPASPVATVLYIIPET